MSNIGHMIARCREAGLSLPRRPEPAYHPPATTRAGRQSLRVFRFVTNGGAPLQNPKPLALPMAIQHARDVAA